MKKKCYCSECQYYFNENNGKWLISDQEKKINLSFMCISCIRNWRKRCLLREGFNNLKIKIILDKEFPKKT